MIALGGCQGTMGHKSVRQLFRGPKHCTKMSDLMEVESHLDFCSAIKDAS